jgi:hypothetical protein
LPWVRALARDRPVLLLDIVAESYLRLPALSTQPDQTGRANPGDLSGLGRGESEKIAGEGLAKVMTRTAQVWRFAGFLLLVLGLVLVLFIGALSAPPFGYIDAAVFAVAAGVTIFGSFRHKLWGVVLGLFLSAMVSIPTAYILVVGSGFQWNSFDAWPAYAWGLGAFGALSFCFVFGFSLWNWRPQKEDAA